MARVPGAYSSGSRAASSDTCARSDAAASACPPERPVGGQPEAVAEQLADRHPRAVRPLELGQQLDHARLEREPPGRHLTHGEHAGDHRLGDRCDVEQRIRKDRERARDELAGPERVVENDAAAVRHQENEPGHGSVLGGRRAKSVDGLESQLHRGAPALYSGMARADLWVSA